MADVNNPSLSANLLTNAFAANADVIPAAASANTAGAFNAQATAPGSTGYNAANLGTANTFNPFAVNSQGYTENKATSQGYDAAAAALNNWNVANNQTVQGQLQGIIAANSPLMQQAATTARQQMNQRGLLNSSMAIGAGQDAVIRQATPIAQADAAMYGRAGEFNANAANQMGQFNAGQTNAARQFTSQAANQVSQFNAQAGNVADQFTAQSANQAASQTAQQAQAAAQANTDAANRFKLEQAAAANRAAEFGAGAQNQAASQGAQLQTQVSLENAGRQTQTSQFNAQQQNAVAEANAARYQQATLANAESANKLVMQQLDNSFKSAVATADNQTKLALQQLDATTRKDLADTESEYKQLMQAQASASELYQQTVKNIADLYNNSNLDAAALSAAVAAQTAQLNNGLQLIQSINKYY